MVLDIQDLGVSSNTPATILYDGKVLNSPAICNFVPVNSIQLIGSIAYCRMTQTGSTWVTKTSAAGVKTTQISGVAGEGVDCTISSAGKVTFFAGRVPQAGELVTVSYRASRRSIVRLEDAANVAAEAAGGVPGTWRWLGKIVRPKARSTVDCESAAAALLSVATDEAARAGGRYTTMNADDIWPGDVLSLSRAGKTTKTVVRDVTIQDGMSVPESLTYHVSFASEWAVGLGITVSEAVATDTALPK